MHHLDDKHPTRPGIKPSTSDFRATTGTNEPSGPEKTRLNKGIKFTVDPVIFTCSNFREFLILGLFTKFSNREFSFFFSGATIIIILAGFLNSRICPPREIRKN